MSVLVFILFYSSVVFAKKDISFAAFANSVRAGQWQQAQKELSSQVSDDTDPSQRALAEFGLGVAALRLSRTNEAEAHFRKSVDLKFSLEDYSRFFLGQILRDQGKSEEAKKEFEAVERVAGYSPYKYFESQVELARVAMQEEKWGLAKKLYDRLERRMRRDPRYPELLTDMVEIEVRLRNNGRACQWARKLYSKYPGHSSVDSWGIDLQKNRVADRTVPCLAGPQDQKRRIRNLQMQGKSEKAFAEIKMLQERSTPYTRFAVDLMVADYLIQEGEVVEALNLLLPYYKDYGRSFGYLMLLGKAAARAGEYQLAVSAFSRAHDARGGKWGRTALFQAAFMSYQFQDYDGAARKFQDVIRKYPRSGLARDARWHLAWIRYLRGDYLGAHEGFKQFLGGGRRNRRTHEKATYWSAVALLKLGKTKEATELLRDISRDRLMGYYSLAAQARLSQIKDVPVQRITASSSTEETGRTLSLGLGQIGIGPGVVETSEIAASAPAEESESEEDINTMATVDDDAPEDEVAENAEGPSGSAEGQIVAELSGLDGALKDDRSGRRHQRAEDLVRLGFHEWAKYELLELERLLLRTGNAKNLLSQYQVTEAFHRSSYLAETYFARNRATGMTGDGRNFWEFAYPRAYDRFVSTAARDTGVPEEFAWGIMRAESHFKPDVKSPVGAMGLMQLMPYTAQHMARLLGWRDFRVATLNEPRVNIQMGVSYLARLYKIFEGNIPLAAAAYNAGPHRVKAWLKNFGSLEMDEFVEHIPFLETRNYVKKVTSNYVIYQALYAKRAPTGLLAGAPAWLAKPVGVKFSGPLEAKEIWE